MKLVRRGHTNKDPTPKNKQNFECSVPKYRNEERAIIVLENTDTNRDFPQRVAYGRRGEMFRRNLREYISSVYKFNAQERVEQVKERIMREEIYKRRASNIAVNASMSILEKFSKKWMRVVQKSTQTHVICARSFVKCYTSTDTALEVR